MSRLPRFLPFLLSHSLCTIYRPVNAASDSNDTAPPENKGEQVDEAEPGTMDDTQLLSHASDPSTMPPEKVKIERENDSKNAKKWKKWKKITTHKKRDM